MSHGPHFQSPLSALARETLRLGPSTSRDQLEVYLDQISKNSVSTDSVYFMNQLMAGVRPEHLMAESVLAKTRTTLATFEASPTLTQVELEVILALGERIGYAPDLTDGVCVPGGSAANLMGVHLARHRLFPNSKATGWAGLAPLRVYVSEEAHYSFQKAVIALGIGTDHLIAIPTNENGKMIPSALTEKIESDRSAGFQPTVVVATAGTTVFGAFDPIRELAAIAKKQNIWLHVDAAWGGPVLFSEKHAHLMDGIAFADSITFDGHKLLGAGMTSSFFLTRHPQLLLQANDADGGRYLFHHEDEEPNPSFVSDRGRVSWQCGRRGDALALWTLWKSLGTEGLGQFVDRLMAIQAEIVEWISVEPRLKLVRTPEFLNICIRVFPKGSSAISGSFRDQLESREWSRIVRERLKAKNLAFINFDSDETGTFLRLILTHPDLQVDHVLQILDWILAEELVQLSKAEHPVATK